MKFSDVYAQRFEQYPLVKDYLREDYSTMKAILWAPRQVVSDDDNVISFHAFYIVKTKERLIAATKGDNCDSGH